MPSHVDFLVPHLGSVKRNGLGRGVQARMNDMTEPAKHSTPSLVNQLKSLLSGLQDNPYPAVPNPPACKKRASVALILRIRPTFPDEATIDHSATNPGLPTQDRLNSFFDQSWVQRGDPEILFIKRAAREGDRWTGHIALPGGKHEEGDQSDMATSIRETLEEIGLDLATEHSTFVGNLPERVVTTSWGTVPLMVLCPFVFLLTRYDLPPLRLQPSEVSSVHWVSMRALLAPSLRTYEHADVADRLARRGGGFLRNVLRLMLGQMLFAAVRLIPSESIYCSSAPGFIPLRISKSLSTSVKDAIVPLISRDYASSSKYDRPLLLWGLTHGIMADFLDLLPTSNTFKLWTWPTFSPWDLQIMVWLMTYRLHKRKVQELDSKRQESPTVIEEGLDTLGVQKNRWQPHGVHMDGLGLTGSQDASHPASSAGAIGHLLEGHYDLMRRAVVVTLMMRLGFGAGVLALVLRQMRSRR
ncbi:hypothetical protein MMC27_007677 [Xylographa pallens]|nr:hypothetical protein [Xylographa pallens]